MSGNIIPTPAYKAADGQSFGTQQEKGRLGIIPLSLTEYDTNTVPQIAAGSCVEISGSIFQFSSNDTITGTEQSGQINYIMLTVSGSGDSQEVEGSWTTTAPTWNTSKQGWYDATNAKRYVGKCYFDGTYYTQKMVYSAFQGLSDKNGNEVVAVQMETKGNTTGGSIAAESEADVDVTGFSWTPTAILSCQLAFGATATYLIGSASYPGGGSGGGTPTTRYQYISIVGLTPGANKVTVRIRNSHNTNAYYYDNIIVTAVKAL